MHFKYLILNYFKTIPFCDSAGLINSLLTFKNVLFLLILSIVPTANSPRCWSSLNIAIISNMKSSPSKARTALIFAANYSYICLRDKFLFFIDQQKKCLTVTILNWFCSCFSFNLLIPLVMIVSRNGSSELSANQDNSIVYISTFRMEISGFEVVLWGSKNEIYRWGITKRISNKLNVFKYRPFHT